ncbi:MAG: lytic murein transglycosylase B [Pigmentiphaga sp.]|nr:lytic murein transglycosylase B [Pigmentiphaga sp.]
MLILRALAPSSAEHGSTRKLVVVMRAAVRLLLLPSVFGLAACSTAPSQPARGLELAGAPEPASAAPAARMSDMVTVSAANLSNRPRAPMAGTAWTGNAGAPPSGQSGFSNNAAAMPAGGSGFTANAAALPPAQRAFAEELAASRQLPLGAVVAALEQAQRNDTVLRLMAPPARAAGAPPPKRHWPGYRARFVEPVRIRNGLRFWEDNAAALARAEQATGVPAAVIVAILGVETVYGRNMGNFPVLDSLYTLAFHWPAHASRDRSEYFRGELAEYLAMTLGQGQPPRRLRGSYAGAIGIPQFMPGSIRNFAVSARPGQPPDLVNSPDDAIASVANYLLAHGWQRELPVFIDATLPGQPQSWVTGGLEPTLSWQDLQRAGARPRGVPATAGLISAPLVSPGSDPRVGMINLDYATGHTDHRIATANFFAITHYNRSYFYATAVADLAAALEAQRKRPR